MKNILFTLFLLGSANALAQVSDTVSDQKECRPGFNGPGCASAEELREALSATRHHQKPCRERSAVLDNLGCLSASGRTANHCEVKEDLTRGCNKKQRQAYICHDFLVCVEDEQSRGSGTIKNDEKAPARGIQSVKPSASSK